LQEKCALACAAVKIFQEDILAAICILSFSPLHTKAAEENFKSPKKGKLKTSFKGFFLLLQ
jgi:hypothetical protein